MKPEMGYDWIARSPLIILEPGSAARKSPLTEDPADLSDLTDRFVDFLLEDSGLGKP